MENDGVIDSKYIELYLEKNTRSWHRGLVIQASIFTLFTLCDSESRWPAEENCQFSGGGILPVQSYGIAKKTDQHRGQDHLDDNEWCIAAAMPVLPV